MLLAIWRIILFTVSVRFRFASASSFSGWFIQVVAGGFLCGSIFALWDRWVSYHVALGLNFRGQIQSSLQCSYSNCAFVSIKRLPEK